MASSELNSNETEQPQERLVVPGYIANRPEGVFINPQDLYSAGGFDVFIDRMFSGSACFQGLDYTLFLKLLYDADWLASMRDKPNKLKIAAAIIRFSQERQALYRPVKLLENNMRADYIFEKIFITVAYEEPVYGKMDQNGAPQITGYKPKTKQQLTKLDFDEFIAAMWLKGVRFGIDEEAVRKAITKVDAGRITIARQLEPTEGRDAAILEVCPDLHRDNTPKILLSGQADLRAFKNRFPQVAKDARLLKKVPKKLGKQGYKVTGVALEPKIPKDLDLYALSAIGTTVVKEADSEYIIATMQGFLTLDTATNKISVTEKIETKSGISSKTTGDLELSVDEFIEHGEVQEGRIVEGKNMTFTSSVFGNLISKGGNIRIDGNLSGGTAQATGGNITLARSLGSAVRAFSGEVTAKYCENSTILGRTVRIEHAVNCEIVADMVYADVIMGCLVAARIIKIRSSNERKDRVSLITVFVPDFSETDKSITNLQKKIYDDQASITAIMREIELLKSDMEFAKYIALDKQIKSGSIKLNEEQEYNWQKMAAKNAKAYKQMMQLADQAALLEAALKESEEALANATLARDKTGEDISCGIDRVEGQTLVQTMKSNNGLEAFSKMTGSDIRGQLQMTGRDKKRIFSQNSGTINWKYKQNEPADAKAKLK